MYARSVTVRGNRQAVDDALAYFRGEVMSVAEQTDGWIGLSMLADRETGHCIATTAWESEEAMHASAERLRPVRERFAEILGGPPEVQTWEIALLHRVQESPEGACARVAWTRGDPARMEQVLDAYKSGVLPKLEEYPGFCSVSLLVNRGEGIGAGAVTFADRASMEQTRERGRAIRDEFAPTLGISVTDIAEFDLVLAHLRVPETV